MNYKRIIPCLDVKDGQVVKGTRFRDVRKVASPVELAQRYCEEGADELVFYDITASMEGRELMTDVLKQTLKVVTVPLTVGGGIFTLEECERLLNLGASKLSINSGALKNPDLLAHAADRFGSERIVLGCDVKKVDGGYQVYTGGGMRDTGLAALDWIRKAVALGAGEVVLNTIDTDGVQDGYDLELLALACEAVPVPVVASGGAGSVEDFVKLFTVVPQVSAGLAASVFHFGTVHIPQVKRALEDAGVPVRRNT